jgi:hypothetical protein
MWGLVQNLFCLPQLLPQRCDFLSEFLFAVFGFLLCLRRPCPAAGVVSFASFRFQIIDLGLDVRDSGFQLGDRANSVFL